MAMVLLQTPALTADYIVFGRDGKVLLIVRRKSEPFAGHYALPGSLEHWRRHSISRLVVEK